jgi:hypothetical protein
MDGKTLVILEGQQHWVTDSIAQNDDLLRQLFSTLSPELAGAEIKRETGQVTISPRKGTKGTANALTILDAAPIELNPGVVCCLALQQLELRVGLNPAHASSIAQEIQTALEQSRVWSEAVKSTLQQLDRATPHSIVPVGF